MESSGNSRALTTTSLKGIRVFVVLAVVGISAAASAQTVTQNPLVFGYQLTSLSVKPSDSRIEKSTFFGTSEVDAPIVSHKNSVLAAVLSLAVPGLGEYYVGDQVWRGGIFTGLEVGLWLGQIHWIARGDDSTIAFRNYGDEHWSASRYATYLNGLLETRNIDPVANGQDLRTLNVAEGLLDSLGFENFTHRLPITDKQQFYELISKYIQFTAGWDDDVTHQPQDSPHYQEHATMRADMNHQYEIASYFTWGIIANHVLSAIDAALVAHDHNTAIHLHGELLQRYFKDGTAGYIPTAGLAYVF